VYDAFTYGDSDNGFRGGLAGQPLSDELRVLALDGYSGNALPGSTVVLDEDLSSAKKTDTGGVAIFQGQLGPKRSVTVAHKCYQPVTFVDVPVDRVTVYLDPVLSPACATQLDDPLVGGSIASMGTVAGELVWQADEFKREGWTNVPAPKSSDEKSVAYVLPLETDPTRDFQLPAASEAITPKSGGDTGYAFSVSTLPGNTTLYALAGLENRSFDPPLFIAYAMGLVKGVAAKPGITTNEVFISIDVPLDHAMTLDVSGPQLTARGPDRLRASVAVRVGDQGYAILPEGQQTALLPITAPVAVVGLPPLVGSLLGSSYVVSGSAFTGQNESTPLSVSSRLLTTTSGGMALNGFVEIPTLTVPGENGTWDGRELDLQLAPGGPSVELSMFELESGFGLVGWLVVAPRRDTPVRLPDLAALDAELALQRGPISITVTVAHNDSFDSGSLRYRYLDQRGWNGYATDVFHAHY
jgi:hypothetical protein